MPKHKCSACNKKSAQLHPCSSLTCPTPKEKFCTQCLEIGRCTECIVGHCCLADCRELAIGESAKCRTCKLSFCDSCIDEHWESCGSLWKEFVILYAKSLESE